MTKIFSVSGAILALVSLSGNAWASCSFFDGVVSPLTRTVSFGSVIVQRDTPVGTVLATANTGAYNSGRSFYGCTIPYTHRFSMELFRVISSYGNNVFNTNIEGVGVRVISPSNRYMPYDGPHIANSYVVISNISVQLVKTRPGAVGAGRLTNGTLASGSIVNHFYGSYVGLAGVNTIIPVACSVSTTAIAVPMGDVPRTQFAGPGSVGDVVSFFIPLNCDANTRVKVALDGNAHSSGIVGLLALTASPAAARGVGVRLFYNNAPVALRTPISVGTVAVGGPFSIPLVARYYQADQAITAGQANSTATFTMTYN